MYTQLGDILSHIQAVDKSLWPVAQAHLDSLTKPQGSLGYLEHVAAQIFCIQKGHVPLRVDPVRMFTVAGDHGVVAEGISPFPQAVTRQMVHNFLDDGAAINVLCRSNQVDLHVVDAGCVGGAFSPHAKLIDRRLGEGTANFTLAPAMDTSVCIKGLLHGIALAEDAAKQGYQAIGIGEMGIGNTTAATALFCAFLQLDPHNIAGPGAGSDAAGISHKARVVAKALALHKDALNICASEEQWQQWKQGVRILAHVGGFEIAVMAGIALGAAKVGCMVLVDGFISTAAYVAARHICPQVEGYAILSHNSAEPGYIAVLEALGSVQPLLHLQLRLGEGTGAALAVPLLRAAVAVYNTMATFSQAGVAEKVCTPI